MQRKLTLIAIVLLMVLAVLWVGGGFDRLAIWAASMQRSFQNSIAAALRGVRGGQTGAMVALLTACFAYGLAHAAGPGHGKVLIGGYGFARKVPMLRLSLIALAASMGQAVTAIVLVYTGVMILNLGRDTLIGVTEDIMAPASYGAIALIGLWLVWRGTRRMRGGADDHGHHHDGEGTCSHCGHAHGPTIDEVESAGTLREAVVLIAGIAIRPCTGALFVLIITWQMGIGMAGILGAFTMALGTAAVTIGVGLAATGLRGGLLAGLAGSPRAARIAAVVEVAAGLLVAFLAGGLLLRSI